MNAIKDSVDIEEFSEDEACEGDCDDFKKCFIENIKRKPHNDDRLIKRLKNPDQEALIIEIS